MATATASQPAHASRPEIIDVDAFEEDAVVFTGFRGHPRSQPHSRSSAGPSSSSHNHHDDEVTFTGFRRRSPRRALRSGGSAQVGPSAMAADDNVIVLDSDEDMPLASSSSSRQAPSKPFGTRSRLMSPPPPAPQRGHTPGVPPLPHHLASQASFPRRYRAPNERAPDVPPPIRPLSRPLPYEARLPSVPRLPPRSAAPPPPAAPRSHHQPSMGLGGALIALNRQNALQEANRANQERGRSYGGFLPSFSEIWRRVTGYGGEAEAADRLQNNERRWRHRVLPWSWSDVALDHEEEFLSPFGNDDAWFGLPHHLEAIRPAGRFPPPAEKIPLWKPEYTHPHKLAPGFTFDFAAPDEPSTIHSSGTSSPDTVIVLDEDVAGPSSGASASSSATAVETTLVCARCLDPLVLAPADGSSPEDAKMRRVWALRCGHMLDGKCVAELMVPPDLPAAPVSIEPPDEAAASSDKGKGKARADTQPADAPVAGDQAPAAVQDRKGKRKAVEPLEREGPPKRPTFAAPAEPEEDNSIRSRLRSRTRAAADVSPSSSGGPGASAHVTPAEDGWSTGGIMSSPRRGGRHLGVPSPSARQGQGPRSRAKGKGKGRAKVERKPVIEAEHEWRCPVAGCGCVHYSVRVDGVWTNDEGRGPIALFV
ncbi:hypothetical protein BV20DRAFT_998283 [Pilatotrama ljubarskyi]|nr:hypothetical protein BV20DRAFT_998283 [Pilatotrama ljubarskyi]